MRYVPGLCGSKHAPFRNESLRYTAIPQRDKGRVGSRLRWTVVLPIDTVALILDLASSALGKLAAWIAGDNLA